MKMSDQEYLLLIEDETMVQANNKKLLERRGYALRQAYTLAEAWAIIEEGMPFAIVLDIQLPDGSGLDFLREFRKISNVPVLILTAMGTSEDIIRGLETGGDYYLPKPYNLKVFLTHIEALVRRASIMPETLGMGPFKIETASGIAYMNGEDMMLAAKEVALLGQFIQHPDKALGAEYLYEKVWGQEMAGDAGALKNAMSRLRKKLSGSGYTITAERNEGYVFELELE